MNLTMKIALGSKVPTDGLNPLKSDGAFMLVGKVGEDVIDDSSLTVQIVPQGRLQEVGIVEVFEGSYLINVYARQLTELEAIRDQFNALDPSEYAEFAKGEHVAKMLASNGLESVEFSFEYPEMQG